jgi:rubredoxin
MPKTQTNREIGDSGAQCSDCSWVWMPKPGTEVSGSNGSRNAMTAACNHGRTKKHRVVVIREAHYDYRASK